MARQSILFVGYVLRIFVHLVMSWQSILFIGCLVCICTFSHGLAVHSFRWLYLVYICTISHVLAVHSLHWLFGVYLYI